MHQNRVWILFLCFTIVAMAWFGANATQKVRAYRHLSKQIPAQVSSWEIKEGKGDTYSIFANYFFEFQGRTYHGTSAVTKPYKNPWSAQKALVNFEKKDWLAWVDPEQPVKSTLYKKFPSRIVLSSAVMVALVVYFVILGLFVGGKGHGRRT